MNKRKYFYLEPFVYSKFINNTLFLYNFYSTDYYVFTLSKRESLLKSFVDRLLNSYSKVTLLTESDLLDEDIIEFVNICRRYFFGDVIQRITKPFIFSPTPQLDMKNKGYRENGQFIKIINKEVIKNVHVFSLSKATNCSDRNLCDNGYKQIQFPVILSNGEADNNNLGLEFLLRNKIAGLERIDFYSVKILKVFKVLNMQKDNVKVRLHYYYSDILFNKKFLELFKSVRNSISINIWANTSVNNDILLKVINLLKKEKIIFKVNFVVTQDQDLKLAKSFFQENNAKYKLIPFYNGNNYSFFKHNVFIDNSFIADSQLSEREIYANSFINRLRFGKVYILPNGNVHTNLLLNSIGNLQADSLEVIYDSLLTEDTSEWFTLKKHKSPCSRCVFHDLCPPLTFYEYAMNKYNLCKYDIKENKWF